MLSSPTSSVPLNHSSVSHPPLPLPYPDREGTKRAFIVGPSGSGKSVLARQILLGMQRFYGSTIILDPKSEFHLPGAKVYEHWRDLCYRDPAREAPVRIYRPTGNELSNRWAANHIFWWIWARKNTLFYIDEVLFYARGMEVPPGLLACITTGRTRKINVGGIFATQRPAFIPLEMLSESEHHYVFRLRMHKDRQRMQETAGISEADQLLLPEEQHAFFYSFRGRVSGPLNLPQEVARR